jgi:hypothetical protein
LPMVLDVTKATRISYGALRPDFDTNKYI